MANPNNTESFEELLHKKLLDLLNCTINGNDFRHMALAEASILAAHQADVDRRVAEAYERGRSDAVMEAVQARNAEGETKQWLS